jgi:hypothetical protein
LWKDQNRQIKRKPETRKGIRSFSGKRKEQQEHELFSKTIQYTKKIKDTKKKKKEDYLLLKNKIIAGWKTTKKKPEKEYEINLKAKHATKLFSATGDRHCWTDSSPLKKNW